MLAWVSLLIRRQIARARLHGLLPPPISASDVFAGGYISDNDAENAGRSLLLDSVAGQSPQPDELTKMDANIKDLREGLHQRLDVTRSAGREIPFLILCQRFHLTTEETDLLMVVAAAAMDSRIRRLLAYLQNDFSKRRPDAGTTLATLVAHASGAKLPWHLLDPDGTLRFFNLILVSVDRERATWLMEHALSMPDAVSAYVARGAMWLDESIAGYSKLMTPKHSWDSLFWAEEDRQKLKRRFEMFVVRGLHMKEPSGLLLRGLFGSGRKSAALAMCKEHGFKLLVIDASHLPSEEEAATVAMRTALRDALLFGAIIYFENIDVLKRDNPVGAARLHAICAVFRRNSGPMFFGTESEERLPIEDMLELSSVTIPALAHEERLALWRSVMPAEIDTKDLRYLSSQFPTLPGLMVAVGSDIQLLQKNRKSPLDSKDLSRQVLERSRHNLRGITTEVHSNHSWDDVILPDDIRERCRRIEQFAKVQTELAQDWGLGSKLMTHRGISALFSGPPGVGKTMVAAIIGKRLGFDVFRIDISRVLSKWVGETEKNLAKVFDEANRTRAVLIFDEADALFSKRTDVKSANDRYSNVEVNFLLQKMETFEGVIILTTNLEKAIDEAFVRRLNFKIRFPEPSEAERCRIWSSMIPDEIVLDEDVDLVELSQAFDVTGGFIRNAVIRATVIAYSRHTKRPRLARKDLMQAISEELQESGRLG